MRAILILSLLLAVNPAQADTDAGGNPPIRERNLSTAFERRKHFIQFGLGTGPLYYGGELRSALSGIEKQAGVSRIRLAPETAFYLPLRQKGAFVGPAFMVHTDFISFYDTSITSISGLIAASFQQYYSGRMGDGFFFRGDLGPGFRLLSASNGTATNLDSLNEQALGFGLNLGIGYGVPLGENPVPSIYFGMYLHYLKLLGGDYVDGLSLKLGITL